MDWEEDTEAGGDEEARSRAQPRLWVIITHKCND